MRTVPARPPLILGVEQPDRGAIRQGAKLQVAYLDFVGIPIACFGETKNIRMGRTFTVDQCTGMLLDSLSQADVAVSSCVKVPLSDTRRAALISFTYNVGGFAFCGSTLVRKLNAGDGAGACDELPK